MISSTKIEGITVSIDLQSDGVYLNIDRPTGNTNKLDFGSVRGLIDNCGVQEWDFATVLDATETMDPKMSVRVSANAQLKVVDESASVKVSADKMLAEIVFFKEKNGGKKLARDEVELLLKQERVESGIDMTLLSKLFVEREYDISYNIAEGKRPVNGMNGYIEYFFNTGAISRKPKELEDGKIDYMNLDLFQVTRTNQTLATVHPPTEGVNGYDVVGNILNATSGKDTPSPLGKNVRFDEETGNVLAELDGQIVFQGGKINVNPVLELPKNVDNTTGNINFLGTVVVKENVISGFRIIAMGNVEVYGVVEGAMIDCDGDLSIKGGVQGMGKAVLSAKGSIVAKFIENATVVAGGDIIADSLVRCEIKCGGSLTLAGKRGQIIGGSTKVLQSITADTIGSQMEASTEIQSGLDPDLYDEYMEKKAEIAKLKKELSQLNQIIDTLAKAREKGALTEPKKAILVKSLQSKTFIKSKSVELYNEAERLIPELAKGSGIINVHKVVNPGVKITIGNAILYVKEKIERCSFSNVDGEIVMGTLL